MSALNSRIPDIEPGVYIVHFDHYPTSPPTKKFWRLLSVLDAMFSFSLFFPKAANTPHPPPHEGKQFYRKKSTALDLIKCLKRAQVFLKYHLIKVACLPPPTSAARLPKERVSLRWWWLKYQGDKWFGPLIIRFFSIYFRRYRRLPSLLGNLLPIDHGTYIKW